LQRAAAAAIDDAAWSVDARRTGLEDAQRPRALEAPLACFQLGLDQIARDRPPHEHDPSLVAGDPFAAVH